VYKSYIRAARESQYSEHIEQIAGPNRYLHKESLWPHLAQFVDHALRHFREIGRGPDVVHGHHADAGAVGVRFGELLNPKLVSTGHSLGRVKKVRLLEKGQSEDKLESVTRSPLESEQRRVCSRLRT
jgi:hypothetical protein